MTKPVINRDISITWFLFHDLQTFGRSLENSFPTIPPTTVPTITKRIEYIIESGMYIFRKSDV
tara:strand:+ start:576 stop:764 length:189 start_codon:yes stop_codon:yes gene_type:complete